MTGNGTAGRQQILLVDGYNVLRSGSRYQEAFAHPDYTDDAFNTARERLINDVINYAGRDYKAVIVFDGADNEFSTGEVETMVVTSDATIQDTVFGGGIDRMSANGFSRGVGMYYEDVHLDETPKVALKRTLGDRIKPDVLEKLKAMRDGA